MNKNKYSNIVAGTMTWGAWGNNLNKTEMLERIHHCLENNITTFDHADIYGDYSTENDFGNAFIESGIDRNNVQFITKCGIQYLGKSRPELKVKHYNYTKDYIIASAEQSLKNLKTDYIDLFLLHRPSPLMEPEVIAEAFETLRNTGKVKHFGVSNFTASQMELVKQHAEISTNQIEFSLTQHTAMHDGTLDYMQTNNIGTMSWSPLGNVFKEDTEQTRRIHKQLGNLMDKYNATEDQLLLAWILKHPANIRPVIGTTNTNRMTNAVKATAINLDLEDWFLILVACQGHKVP
ncbi:aldo/keto reductase family oxidoreductase [Lacinutrix sp. 5H-3-7-4]|uniref:aldo/keto reductase n=1 Tax=Lacinutrix sp. (strain 5H-3-7-4) TaxID=983544 RepID=UPI00020A35A9|nr:aldo/keto reductase [Lacinutrix sp. 5H-3-7-4]AEH00752.1 aldo/keto reductase [Lacinutrix sp. 5H-3-7-4]